MRRTLPLLFLFIFVAVALINCGDSRKVLPVTNTFAFLREAPANSEGPMQPLLGGFQGPNFVINSIIDSSTGNPVTADIHSIILSPDGKKATLDMWPSLAPYGRSARNASSGYWADIFVANANGSSLVQITHGETYVAHPSFSPDNSKVIFLSDSSSSPWDTMIANVDGTNMTDLTADSPVCHHEAMFSPDGAMIVFAGHTDTPPMDIYVMNADGTNPVNLTQETSDNVENLFPTFSTDGTKIAFTKVVYGETTTAAVYIMNADGTSPIALTTTGLDGYPRYLGKNITFVSYRDGNMELYTMAPDGTAQTRLTSNTVFDSFSADQYGFISSFKTPQARHVQQR